MHTFARSRSVSFTDAFVSSLDHLSIHPEPMITTPNALIFRTNDSDPKDTGALAMVVKIAKIAGATSCPSPAARLAHDSLQELDIALHLTYHGGHPNVVQFHGGCIESDDTTKLAMEWCPGGDLYTRLEASSEHCLPLAEALDALRQVASGLAFLHSCNIAHRDVSMENVLVGSDGLYKLCDFGLAARADQCSDATVGKDYYMAPEIVARETYDPVRADIWSLGILLFVLLTGSPLVKLALADASDYRAFRQLGVKGVLRMWKMLDRCTDETLELLDGMLQVDSTKRFGDVEQILTHAALV